MIVLFTATSNLGKLIDFTALGAIAVGIAKTFEWVEAALNADGKKAIARWLRNLPLDSEVGSWSAAFSHLVDHVFGRNAVSLTFFLRSCIASLLAVVIVVIIYLRAYPLPMNDVRDSLIVLGILCIPNLFVDYLSLLISRAIVRSMAKDSATRRALALLILDLVLKILAATCIILFCSAAVHLLLENSPHPIRDAIRTVEGFFSGLPFPFTSGGGLQYGIFFYASFFTSIWVLFYVLGGLLIKALMKTTKLWRVLVPFLDLDANPLKAIGRVIGATVVALYAVGTGVSAVTALALL